MNFNTRITNLENLISRLRNDGRSPVNFYAMMAKAAKNIRNEMQKFSPISIQSTYLSIMLNMVETAEFEIAPVVQKTAQEIEAEFQVLFGNI